MIDRIYETLESRFRALREIEREKLKVPKAYNKREMEKSFQAGIISLVNGHLAWRVLIELLVSFQEMHIIR
jgi:hydrogenase maturation factor